MKNKKITYFLLLLAVIIWGAVVMRIILHFSSNDNNSSHITATIQENSNSDTTKSFILLLNYRDPFLGGYSSYNKKAGDGSKNGSSKVSSNKRIINQGYSSRYLIWPDVYYIGLIENKGNQEQVALIKINDRDYLLKAGDYAQNYKLEKAFKDSIWLTYNEETRTVLKGKKDNTNNF